MCRRTCIGRSVRETEEILALAVSADGHYLATLGSASVVRFWDFQEVLRLAPVETDP